MKRILLLFSLLAVFTFSYSQTLFNETFESGTATGWTQVTDATDDGWLIGLNTDLQSTNWPLPAHTTFAATNDDACNCDKNDEYFITPVINLSAVTTATLTFDYFFGGFSYLGDTEVGKVKVSTNGGTTWTDAATLTGETAWTGQTISLASFAGNSIKIAFHYSDGTGWLYGFAIDNVKVYAPVAYDAGIQEITNPSNSSSCSFTATEQVTVVIANTGLNPISNFAVAYTIDGGTPVVETYTGTIASGQTANHTFAPTIDFSAFGSYEIDAYTNLTADGESANDHLINTVISSANAITIQIITDDYFGETTWTLENSAGDVVLSGEGVAASTLTTTVYCADAGECYTFTINDAFGDGIESPGGWEVLWNGVHAGGNTNFASPQELAGMGDACTVTDVGMIACSIYDYQETGASVNITGTFESFGIGQLASVDVNWTIDGGTVNTQTLSGLTMLMYQSNSFTHNIPLIVPAVGNHTIDIWVSNPSTGTDNNTANDHITKIINVLSQIPPKHVVIEEFTGAWCGYCPDGAAKLNEILTANPSMYGVAIHNEDAMAFTDGNTVDDTYSEGYPTGMVDRFDFAEEAYIAFNRGNWATRATQRAAMVTPVKVDITKTYNATTRALTADVTATFYGNLTGEFRLNCFIIEDGIPGIGTDYEQTNYYTNAAQTPYYGANPIVGYIHNHVLRAMLGGAWGSASSIPATVTDNGAYTKQYTYTIPATWVPDNCKLIAVVQKYSTDNTKRDLLNALEIDMYDPIGIETIDPENIVVYPNPTNGNINIVNAQNSTIMLFNILGEEVASISNAALNETIDLSSLAAGTYTIRIVSNKDVLVKKIILNK